MHGEAFQIKAATAADADRLAALRVEAMRPSLEAVGRFDPDRARHRFLSTFSPAETRIIQIEGRLAGFFVLRRRDDHLYLDHLYVAPSFQGRGIGRDVVDGLKRDADAAGLPLRLTALNGSPANGFYCACGFSPVSSDALDTVYQWSPAPKEMRDAGRGGTGPRS